MQKMVWIIVFQLLAATVGAQYKEFPKLQKLFDAGKYDKCIKKAEKYAKNEKKELIPQVYLMKSWLAIGEDQSHKQNKIAVNKALTAARKITRKDGEAILFDKYLDDFFTLQVQATAKADALVKDGKCNNAIRLYDNINGIFNDAASAYKKSLCMLKDEYQNKDGFVLLRNTVLGIYRDYKKGSSFDKLPQAFARLSKEYLKRRYYTNAEDILRKGVEVFPKDTFVRNEMVGQIQQQYNSTITSDYQKDLQQLLSKLLWADSCFDAYDPIEEMLQQTNEHILILMVKYEIDNTQLMLDFIRQCEQQNPDFYTQSYINSFITSLYDHSDIKRIEEGLKNITRLLISYNTAIANKGGQPVVQYVYGFILEDGNYRAASYFLQQTKSLYPKDKTMLAAMQVSLEDKLIDLLTQAPKDELSLDLAETFLAIAPNNKKLIQLEQNLYVEVLKAYSAQNNFAHFYTVAYRGLERYPAHPTMMQLKKEMVIKDYTANYTPNLILDDAEMKVVCYVPSCTPGKVSEEAQQKFINLLNYLRRQVGMYDSCFLDADLNEMAQLAALMMKARNELSHAPDSSWKCFSQKGKKAAGSSNLSLGHAGTNALLGQMEDNGEGNGSVGHRRWILNPYNKVFGHGSTDNSMSLYVFGKYFNNPEKDRTPNWDGTQYFSWPPKDFAPIKLVPKRWSFSLENADFSSAKIKVTLKGKNVKIKPEPVVKGYAVNTCVWQMEDEVKAGNVYTVTLTNVSIAGETKTKNFTYTIEVLDL